MAESNALVNLLSDPATLIGLGVVAVGTAYYMATRPRAQNSSIPLDNQSIELPVSAITCTTLHTIWYYVGRC